jgi:hypothetical protein
LPAPVAAFLGWMLTFAAVMLGWIFFRASGLQAAGRILGAITSLDPGQRLFGAYDIMRVFCFLAAALALPSVADLFGPLDALLVPTGALRHASLFRPVPWQPSYGWGMTIGLAGGLGLLATGGTTEFLYFRF